MDACPLKCCSFPAVEVCSEMLFMPSVARRLLHRLHQGPPEAQPAGHRPRCGRPGLGRRLQAGPVGVPGRHQPGENVLLPALGLRQAAAHQLAHHHQGGHPGAAEEVHGAGQSLQVCTVQADAPGRTGWVKQGVFEVRSRFEGASSSFCGSFTCSSAPEAPPV